MMKVFMQPIEPIVWFTEEGVIKPIRFRIVNDAGSYTVIKVNQIIDWKEEKLAGNRMLVFTCNSIIQGMDRRYEIKYETRTNKWFLYKM